LDALIHLTVAEFERFVQGVAEKSRNYDGLDAVNNYKKLSGDPSGSIDCDLRDFSEFQHG
jgi:hypothetical protein